MADTEREAVAFQDGERWTEALAAWMRLLQLDKQHVLAPRGVVMALCRLGRIGEAEDLLLKPRWPRRSSWWPFVGRRRAEAGQSVVAGLLPETGEAGTGWTEAALWYFRFLAVERAADRRTAFIKALTSSVSTDLLLRLAANLSRFKLLGASNLLLASLPVEMDGDWGRLARAWRSYHSDDVDAAATALAGLSPDGRRRTIAVELMAVLAAKRGDVRTWQEAVLDLNANDLPPGFMDSSMDGLARTAPAEELVLRLQDLPAPLADAAFSAGLEVIERSGLPEPDLAEKLAGVLLAAFSEKAASSEEATVLIAYSQEVEPEVERFLASRLPPPLRVLRQLMMVHRPLAPLGQLLSRYIASCTAQERNEVLLLKARHCLVWKDRQGALAALRDFDPAGETGTFGLTFSRFLPELVQEADRELVDVLIPILNVLPPRIGIRMAGMMLSAGQGEFGLDIARSLRNHPMLKAFEGVWLGDLFARQSDHPVATELYQWARRTSTEPLDGLNGRVRRCLYHDPVLNRALAEGDETAARMRLEALFPPEDLSKAGFTMVPVAQALALSRCNDWRHEEVIPGRDVSVPPAHYFGRPRRSSVVVQHPPVYWAELRDAVVGPNSAATLVNGRLVHPPSEAPNSARYIHADGTIAAYSPDWAVVSRPPVTRRLEAAVSLLGPANNNYYHWMFDICARFAALRRYEPPEGAVLLVDELAMRVPQIGEIVDRLNCWKLPVVILPGNEAFAVERLAVAASSAWGPFHLYDHLDLELADVVILAEAVQALRMLGEPEISSEKARSGRRIYVTRVGAPNPRIVNDAAISEFLREHMGFEIVDPGSMSFAQQVEVFADASVVVGATGAALTNTVFCSAGVKILCLIVTEFEYSAWPMVAEAVGGEMMFLSGQITQRGFNKYHDRFMVDIPLLKQAVSELLDR